MLIPLSWERGQGRGLNIYSLQRRENTHSPLLGEGVGERVVHIFSHKEREHLFPSLGRGGRGEGLIQAYQLFFDAFRLQNQT